MGATPLYGFTYPDPADFVTNGAGAMRVLAESLEAAFAPAGARIVPAGSPTELIAAAQVVTMPGAVEVAGDFALVGPQTRLTYTGDRPRPFLLTAEVTTEWIVDLGAQPVRRAFADVVLRVGTTAVASSPFELNFGEEPLLRVATHTHTLAAVVTLNPGDIVSVAGRGEADAAVVVRVGNAGMSATPTGPALV